MSFRGPSLDSVVNSISSAEPAFANKKTFTPSVRDCWRNEGNAPAVSARDPREGKTFCRYCKEEVRLHLASSGETIVADLTKPYKHRCKGAATRHYRQRK